MSLPLSVVENILDYADYRTLVKFSRSSRMAYSVAQPFLQRKKAPISATVSFHLHNNPERDCVCVENIQGGDKRIEWKNDEGFEEELYKKLSKYVFTNVKMHKMRFSYFKKTGVLTKFAEMGLFKEAKTLTFDVDKRMAYRNYANWFPNLYRFDGKSYPGILNVRKQFIGLPTFRKIIRNYPASEYFRMHMNVTRDVILTNGCLNFIMEQHKLKKTPLKVFVLDGEFLFRASVNKLIKFLEFAAWSCTEYKSRKPQDEENGPEQNGPRCYIEIGSPYKRSNDDSKKKMKLALQRMGITPTETAWKLDEHLFSFCYVFELGGTEMVFRLQDPPNKTEFKNVIEESPYDDLYIS
ncbi:unnamed protein product [Caenorhabditis auriculariae]|uniref:F-box domain-containing protein n=1 Tax=Caenorhabditis auriculariae TaxID=2777116 RepID=A0A8S1HDM9_9PELO|nr:unnamed protein product [Caenorhabditis auriculariae]